MRLGVSDRRGVLFRQGWRVCIVIALAVPRPGGHDRRGRAAGRGQRDRGHAAALSRRSVQGERHLEPS